jgi:transcriptional regulator with XRE-family HTH domain
VSYDPKGFGKILRSLREHFGYSYDRASEISGVNRQYIVRIEEGTVAKPSYPLMIQYTSGTYPYTPSEIAALAGLWELNERDVQPRAMRPAVVREVEQYYQTLDTESAHTFATLLRLLIDQHKTVYTNPPEEPEPKSLPDALPTWARERLLSLSV